MEDSHRSVIRTFLDSIAALCLGVVGTCFYWRGSWDLISHYVLPDREPWTHWLRFGIGAGTLITYVSIPFVKASLDGKSRLTFLLCSRAVMIVHGAMYMFLWRGTWGLADHYLGFEEHWVWTTLCVAYSLLLGLRCSRQLMWPPYVMPHDERPDLLVAVNRLHVEVRFQSSVWSIWNKIVEYSD